MLQEFLLPRKLKGNDWKKNVNNIFVCINKTNNNIFYQFNFDHAGEK